MHHVWEFFNKNMNDGEMQKINAETNFPQGHNRDVIYNTFGGAGKRNGEDCETERRNKM